MLSFINLTQHRSWMLSFAHMAPDCLSVRDMLPPRHVQVEIKNFVESVYGMEVERVNTINYMGKKKRRLTPKGHPYFIRLSDWKKAYVVFTPPPDVRAAWEQKQAEAAAEAERERREDTKRWRALAMAATQRINGGRMRSTSPARQ